MLAHSMTEAPESLTYIAPVFRVSDISRSLAFYRDYLGFAVEFVYGSVYAGVSCDGCHIHFKCSPPTARDQVAFEREEHIDAYIGVRSAEALSQRLASTGVPFVVPLRDMPYGTEFYVRDPDGNVLGFVQLTPTSK